MMSIIEKLKQPIPSGISIIDKLRGIGERVEEHLETAPIGGAIESIKQKNKDKEE